MLDVLREVAAELEQFRGLTVVFGAIGAGLAVLRFMDRHSASATEQLYRHSDSLIGTPSGVRQHFDRHHEDLRRLPADVWWRYPTMGIVGVIIGYTLIIAAPIAVQAVSGEESDGPDAAGTLERESTDGQAPSSTRPNDTPSTTYQLAPETVIAQRYADAIVDGDALEFAQLAGDGLTLEEVIADDEDVLYLKVIESAVSITTDPDGTRFGLLSHSTIGGVTETRLFCVESIVDTDAGTVSRTNQSTLLREMKGRHFLDDTINGRTVASRFEDAPGY
jgi:hypothetical protein